MERACFSRKTFCVLELCELCSTLRFVAPISEKGCDPLTPREAAPAPHRPPAWSTGCCPSHRQLMVVSPAVFQLHKSRTKNHSRESNLLVPGESTVGMSGISVSKAGFYGKVKWINQAERETVAAIRGHGHDI